jgi:DNA-binding MarR family transcriptional regulator
VNDIARLVQRFNAIVNGRSGSRSLLVMHESGLTFPQIIVLYALFFHGEQSLSRLAEATKLSPPAASQMVDRLVEAGFVGREENAEDRRQRVISMKAKGQKLIEQLHGARHAELDATLSRLPADLRKRFAGVLTDVVRELEASFAYPGEKQK